MLQMARADLPDGPVDELELMYVDLRTGTWRQLDAMIIKLMDGRIGIAALTTDEALHSIVQLPQGDVPPPAGTALLTWRRIDGSPPERTLASAHGVRTLFSRTLTPAGGASSTLTPLRSSSR